MRLLRRPLEVIRKNLRPYLALNALVYGMFFVGTGVALAFPELQNRKLDPLAFGADWTASLVQSVSGSVLLFGVTILVVNIIPTALLQIAIPSMIVPFLGIAVFAFRAFSFGVTLAPTNEVLGRILIPHSLTLLIEFQAYILISLGAYVLGKSWLRPSTIGATSRREGYIVGVRQLGLLSLLAAPLFVVGAFYEAFEIIHLVPKVLPR